MQVVRLEIGTGYLFQGWPVWQGMRIQAALMENGQRKNFIFVINPVSGGRGNEDVGRRITSYFSSTEIKPLVLLTEYAGHAKKLCRQLVAQSPPPAAVVAVGGDGTVHEVVSGIIQSGIPLGIVPRGSGNGFARHLGIPMDIDQALALLRRGAEVPVDVLRIGTAYSINVSGVGFDALVAWKFQHSASRGLHSYLRIILGAFFTYRPQNYELCIDGRKSRHQALMVSLANSSQFGNNVLVSPRASVRDGYLDVCILHPFPKWKIPVLFYRVLRRQIDRSPYLEIVRGKKVSLVQAGDLWHLDGEAMSGGSEIEVEVLERILPVIIPEARQNLI